MAWALTNDNHDMSAWHTALLNQACPLLRWQLGLWLDNIKLLK